MSHENFGHKKENAIEVISWPNRLAKGSSVTVYNDFTA